MARVFWAAFFSVFLACGSAHAGTVEEAARAVKSQAESLRGGKEAARRMGGPLLSSDPMKTLDGSTSFGARMICPSSNAFLTLQVLPDLSTGNISSAVFNQDTNMDGAADYSYAVPRVITGVCANGFISCNACNAAVKGCADCSWYLWTADASGRLGTSPASVTQLGGCYCVNKACVLSSTGGLSPTLSNIGIILQNLGGGAVAAIQATLPNTAVTAPKVNETNMNIAYYGQSMDACAGMAGGSSPARYYGNPSALGNAASAEQSAQAADPNSVYTMAANAVGRTTGGSYTSPCAITRNFTVSTTSQTTSGNGSLAGVRTAADVQLRIINSGDSWSTQIYTDAGGDYASWTTLRTVTLAGMKVTAITLCGSTSGGDCAPTASKCYPSSTMPLSVSGCNVVGNHQLGVYYNYGFDYKFDTESEALNDQCQLFESDPNCRLQAETEYDDGGNGVTTYNAFNPTGYTPLAQTCRTITTDVAVHTLCRPWWSVKRTYLCTGGQQIDISAAKNRSREIATSSQARSSYSNGTLSVGFTANGIAYGATVSGLKERSSTECEKICKTFVPVQNTATGTGGSASQTNTSTDAKLYYYRLCAPDATGDHTVCPVSATGETVVEACACPDVKNTRGFGAAAAAMGALKNAAQDLICSDGVKK